MAAELEDIEDVAEHLAIQKSEESSAFVVNPQPSTGRPQAVPREGHVPAAGTVWVKTWGCSHNNSDGEYMAGCLSTYGFRVTADKEEADLWLLNSCTVKSPSEQSLMNAIEEAEQKGKQVVLAGCVSQAQPDHKKMEPYSIIGVQQIDRVVEVVEEALKGHKVRLLGAKKDGGARLHLPKIRKNPLIEIIPINTGCLNECTYCKTKFARGNLRSYPLEEIVARVKAVLEEGVVEIWLTSEDLGTYGRDIGTSLPELCWRLVELLPEGTMMRLGMTNPPYIREHLDEITKILNHPQVFSFIHIPVQAASDMVLRAMRREYTCDEFLEVVNFLRAHVEDVAIMTDIICGFPTETPEDFEETLELVRRYEFPMVNISQFYPRPGTPAFRMKLIPTTEVKRRSRALTAVYNSFRPRDRLMGRVVRVLCTEVARDNKHYAAHTKQYDQVLVPKDPALLGKSFLVKVYRTERHCVFGHVIQDSVDHAPQRPPALPAGNPSTTHTAPFVNAPVRKEERTAWRRYRWELLAVMVTLLAFVFTLLPENWLEALF